MSQATSSRRETLQVAIRGDLRRVARETGAPEGHAPSLVRYRKIGRFGEAKVRAVAGGWREENGRMQPRLSWSDAVRRLGFIPFSRSMEVGDGELIADLRRVALRCGRAPNEMPTTEEYREHGEYSYMTVLRRFAPDGSWWTVARYLGMQPSSAVRRGSLSADRLISDYQRIARELGYEPGGLGPTRREFAERVPYSERNTDWHVGPWRKFVQAAGFKPRGSGRPRRRTSMQHHPNPQPGGEK